MDTSLDDPGLPAPPADLLDLDRTALFLDLDGTLARFQPRPDLVVPEATRTRRLRALGERLGGRLAVLSGRSLADLDRILEGSVAAAAGVHGLERRSPTGRLVLARPHPGLSAVAAVLEAFVLDHPRTLLERKSQSLALHYREAPDAGGDAVDLVRRLAATEGLTVQLGHEVAELRTPGADKGDALSAFMSEPPFEGATPLMVGDDLTDETAFAAAAHRGGCGILVGTPRPTAARYALSGVGAVEAWLDAALDGGERGRDACRA